MDSVDLVDLVDLAEPSDLRSLSAHLLAALLALRKVQRGEKCSTPSGKYMPVALKKLL